MGEKNLHFISIGGSVMHSLAITLKKKGYKVTGSDDEIYEPSYSNLKAHGILPKEMGWNENNIHKDLDAVVIGMHAKGDNPEVLKARNLGLKTYSFPEYVRKECENKHRIVVAGSHGKTTITAIIMHVLKYANRDFDYLIGASVDGFDNLVQITEAPLIIIEGDEYFSSPVDKTPKFLKYDHHNAIISGIAWDHINAFPTAEDYERQFELFADNTPKSGNLFYYQNDPRLAAICNRERKSITVTAYTEHPAVVRNGNTYLKTFSSEIPIKIFGRHNLQNIQAALEMVKKLGIKEETFYQAISSFKGASKRLQLLGQSDQTAVYLDYAHAPSKVKATVSALKEQMPERKLVACFELHTYSSLNPEFIEQYYGSLDSADEAAIFVNPENIKHKDKAQLNADDIVKGFHKTGLQVFFDRAALDTYLKNQKWSNKNLLLMSSGNFASMDVKTFVSEILGKLAD
ncbi:MAG: UDP-N-acetylmuramate--L-alanine ligase [Cyclobacteriaceae bacterium]